MAASILMHAGKIVFYNVRSFSHAYYEGETLYHLLSQALKTIFAAGYSDLPVAKSQIFNNYGLPSQALINA
ncbi:MAG: hypothetical protein ABIW38_06980 [Ferruginibacter sp.]